MAYFTDTPLGIIYEELILFVARSIDLEYIYTGDRPDKTDAEMQKFVVISLPAELKDMVCGSKDFMLDSFGLIYIFCRAKSDSTLDQITQSELTYKIKKTFPLNAEHITATKPRVIPGSYDGNGFYISTISFKLKSKPNAFTISD